MVSFSDTTHLCLPFTVGVKKIVLKKSKPQNVLVSSTQYQCSKTTATFSTVDLLIMHNLAMHKSHTGLDKMYFNSKSHLKVIVDRLEWSES